MLKIADALSLSRVLVAPLLVWAVLQHAMAIAVALFVWAVMSDILDGIITRRSTQRSSQGALIDHGSGAVIVTTCCALWAWLGILPTLLCVFIPISFIHYALDARQPLRSGPRPSQLGRFNGIAYFVMALP